MRKKICFIVAMPGTARSFLSDHIRRLSRKYDVYLVANAKDEQLLSDLPLAGYYVNDIHREISLVNDLCALCKLTKYFRGMKFDAVHSVTPKAGFVTALAGKIAGIKNRIHIFTGQVWANKKGLTRYFLRSIDKMIVALNTHILIDGNGQQQFLIEQNVVKTCNSQVLGYGSICGVNLRKFSPSSQIRDKVRAELNISNKIVFSFMGRLNHDKGIPELLEAFNKLCVDAPRAYLILFGHDEENYSDRFKDYHNLNDDNFKFFGSTSTPFEHLQASDVFVLPSYREGFGSSVIEASSLGLPVICSDAYGLRDAMLDNETGLRCHVGDVESLYDAMMVLYNNPSLREQLGATGRQRVIDCFSEELVGKEWEKFYDSLFEK